MAKLFVTSDIHSFYQPFKKALDAAGFDPNNSEHWLIVCGDCFDRGPDSGELFYYLMSLERKILIKGNHELLLKECCLREFPYSHDFSNGTVRTINDIGGAGEGYCFDKCCENTWYRTVAYRNLLINYFETENYIFVHSWIPTTYEDTYLDNWRNAPNSLWEDATWGNPFEKAERGLNQTSKTIVFGHWHCSTGWAKKEGRSEFGADAKWDIYKDDEQKIISLDACTAYTGQVNILVIEDTFLNLNKFTEHSSLNKQSSDTSLELER